MSTRLKANRGEGFVLRRDDRAGRPLRISGSGGDCCKLWAVSSSSSSSSCSVSSGSPDSSMTVTNPKKRSKQHWWV